MSGFPMFDLAEAREGISSGRDLGLQSDASSIFLWPYVPETTPHLV